MTPCSRCSGRTPRRARDPVRKCYGDAVSAGVAQLAEAADLKSAQSGFESQHQHHSWPGGPAPAPSTVRRTATPWLRVVDFFPILWRGCGYEFPILAGHVRTRPGPAAMDRHPVVPVGGCVRFRPTRRRRLFVRFPSADYTFQGPSGRHRGSPFELRLVYLQVRCRPASNAMRRTRNSKIRTRSCTARPDPSGRWSRKRLRERAQECSRSPRQAAADVTPQRRSHESSMAGGSQFPRRFRRNEQDRRTKQADNQ